MILFFYLSDHTDTVCPIGTYSSPANRNCSTCPDNSVSTMAGLSQCACIEGYYRAETGEEDLPCSCKYSPCAVNAEGHDMCISSYTPLYSRNIYRRQA